MLVTLIFSCKSCVSLYIFELVYVKYLSEVQPMSRGFKTDGIKMSTVYLHSCVKDIL